MPHQPHYHYEQPTWGAGCTIGAYCVLGVQPIATAANRRATRSDWPAGHVGSRTVIGSHCVIGAGVVIGEDCRIGDHVNIREGVRIGDRCVIGTKADIQFECTMGDDVRIMDCAYIVGGTTIGSGTFIAPGVMSANDPHVAHFGLDDYQDRGLIAPVIGRNVFVGVGAILLPSIVIGDGARIAAGAVVTKDVAAGARVVGIPARVRLTHAEQANWGNGENPPPPPNGDTGGITHSDRLKSTNSASSGV